MVTEHTICRDYCPKCKKHVEPVVPDALPHATIGHHLIALTAWLHYGLGGTIDQIIDILSYHLQTKLTPGGLIDSWRRLSKILVAWYEQIVEEAKNSAYLQADETGWRVTCRRRDDIRADDISMPDLRAERHIWYTILSRDRSTCLTVYRCIPHRLTKPPINDVCRFGSLQRRNHNEMKRSQEAQEALI